jgi:hypothetical protein
VTIDLDAYLDLKNSQFIFATLCHSIFGGFDIKYFHHRSSKRKSNLICTIWFRFSDHGWIKLVTWITKKIYQRKWMFSLREKYLKIPKLKALKYSKFHNKHFIIQICWKLPFISIDFLTRWGCLYAHIFQPLNGLLYFIVHLQLIYFWISWSTWIFPGVFSFDFLTK